MLLLYLTIAWTLGILLARLLWAQAIIDCASPPLWVWGTLAAALVAASILLRRHRALRLSLILLLCACLGAWRFQSQPVEPCFTPADSAFYNGNGEATTWVSLEGVVDGYPDVRDRTTNYTLRVHTLELECEQITVRGTALLQVRRYPEFHYGDQLRVSGLLQTPPEYEDFSYREALARRGIHSLIRYPRAVELIAHDQGNRFWAALYSLRSRLSDSINRILPEPQASLLNGILLGIESGIPRDLYDDFNTTGTSHTIAISGFNLDQT